MSTTSRRQIRRERAAAASAQRAGELREAIAGMYAEIPGVLVALAERRHTRPHTGIGARTGETTMALDALLRHERDERRTQPERPLGLKILNRDEPVSGTGHVPAPTRSLDASQILTDLPHALWSHAGILSGRATLSGICPWPPVGDEIEETLVDVLVRLLALVEHPPTLEAIHDDLELLLARADLAIHGPRRIPVDKPCPWCGAYTLVLERDHVDEPSVISCEDDQRTGLRSPCWCPDPVCGCHRMPMTQRHQWHRVPAAGQSSFEDLADLIATTDAAREADHA